MYSLPDNIKFIGTLQRLEIEPTDRLILTVPSEISDELEARLKAALEREFPNNRVVVLVGGAELSVVGARK
jgi:hypothetical protein